MDDKLIMTSKERAQIIGRIRGEFIEMPGLRLTLTQAQRLWGLDEATCSALLHLLTEQHFLTQRRDGTYARTIEIQERHRATFPAIAHNTRRRQARK